MACKQVYSARLPNGSTSTRYLSPTWAPYEWVTTLVAAPWRAAGAFRNLKIEHLTAPGGATSYTYTLVKNGSDTALTVTLSGSNTTVSDTSTVVTAAVGDLFYWRRTSSGAPATSNQRVSVEFYGTTVNESGYSSLQLFNDTQTWRGGLFMAGQWNTGTFHQEIVAAAGVLTALAYNLSAAPGSGNNYEIALYKNGTKQDGAGGTPDTRVTIADSATTGLWTGTVTLAAGDYVYLEVVPTSTPTAATAGVGVKFVATTDGESQLCSMVYVNLPTSSGPYYASPHWTSIGWDTTEANQDARSGTSSYTLRGLRVRLSSTVSTGPITFALRVGGADANPSATLTSGQQTGSDLGNEAALSNDDLVDFEYTVGGSPGIARLASVAMILVAFSTPPAIIGSFVAGANTTVNTSRAAAFGLDGATHLHDEAGKLVVFGNHRVTGYFELEDPITATPAARIGRARVFIDPADGDLKIVYGDGTIKTIVVDT